MKKLRWDLALAGGVLLVAAVLYLLFRPGTQGAWAVVTVNGEELGRYALNEDRVLTIGEDAYNILEISGGTAAVVEANCGDHTCVRTGAISREGETIVCLPHGLIIRVEGGGTGDFDTMAQ